MIPNMNKKYLWLLFPVFLFFLLITFTGKKKESQSNYKTYKQISHNSNPASAPQLGAPTATPSTAFTESKTETLWMNDFECQTIETCNTSYLLVKPNANQANGAKLKIDTQKKRQGQSSLKSFVPRGQFEGQGSTSKAMIARKGFQFKSGQTVSAQAYFYIPSSSKGRVTVMDFESSQQAGNPGIRIQLQEEGLIFNRDKLKIKPYTYKAPFAIPYDEWFLLRSEIKLGDQNNGALKIYVNDVLVMNETGATIKPDLNEYDTFQVGITARLKESYTLWTDNVEIQKISNF